MDKISVVVCVKNEEQRLADCLKSVVDNGPDEIILVDGNSTDRTVEIARQFRGVRIIETSNSTLTRDRQIGIDAARNNLVAMIDADHRLRPDDLRSLLADMKEFRFDIVQSGLIAYQNHGFWDSAEEAMWRLTHNIPGPRTMIGTAPAIYKKSVFDAVRFDDRITKTIDDTDFAYRLSKIPSIRFGIGRTNIRQYHFATFADYARKFKWYGKGDGEFCRKNPERAPSMLYHLLIRYPFVHSWKALRRGEWKAVPFFMLQGLLRFYGLATYFLRS